MKAVKPDFRALKTSGRQTIFLCFFIAVLGIGVCNLVFNNPASKKLQIQQLGQPLKPQSDFLPRIIVYIFSWNEEQIMPHTLRHYSRYADKIVVLDNNSTDSTRHIVNAFVAKHKHNNSLVEVELRTIDTRGVYPQTHMDEWRSHRWQEAKGQFEWAITVDADEFVHFDVCNKSYTFKHFLRDHQHEADVIAPVGYDIYFKHFPFKKKDDGADDILLTEEADVGVKTSHFNDEGYPSYSKPCIVQVDTVSNGLHVKKKKNQLLLAFMP